LSVSCLDLIDLLQYLLGSISIYGRLLLQSSSPPVMRVSTAAR
jgi:hypothetical protein